MDYVTNLYIALFTGAVCVVQTLTQICPYSHAKCACYDTFVTCSGLQEIPPLVTGINVTYFTTVSFEGGNINNVPGSNLPPGLKKLTFSGHPLTNWADDAFAKSEASIYLLNITGANFKQLPGAFLKLTTLDRLVIADTPIQNWDGPVLQHIAKILPDLALINVGIKTWPTWLSYFHSLHTLYLSRNSLTSIPNDAFNSFRNTLSRIILDNTGLTHIPQAFATLPNLTLLDLSGNSLADVSEVENLASMPFGTKLTDLSISSIGLTKMLNFAKMTSLFSIDLNNNEIADTTTGSLPQLITLLYIQGNKLSAVPVDVAQMSGLNTLLVSNNQIISLEPGTFPPSLVYLNLSYNKLTIVTDTDFTNLVNQETLNLNNNPISTISSLAFTDLTSLITVDISQTSIAQVPEALVSLSSVLSINLATPSLSCPCPADSALVKWFAQAAGKMSISGSCCTGQSIDSYFSGACTTQQNAPASCRAPTTLSSFIPFFLLSMLRFCLY